MLNGRNVLVVGMGRSGVSAARYALNQGALVTVTDGRTDAPTIDGATHRYGTLDEMAAPILFLASDEASYITGSVLPVGGGALG